MNYFNGLIRFCLETGMSQDKKTSQITYQNYVKISIYFIQLCYYIFSEREAQQLKNQETQYLASIFQYSTGMFIIDQFQQDWLTLLIYYVIVSYLSTISVFLLFLSSNKFMARMVNRAFILIPWMLLMPMQQLAIEVITCGRNSKLKYLKNISELECFAYQPWNIAFSCVVTLLLILFAIVQPFCYRNQEILQIHLKRKYSFLNTLIMLLQQLLIIAKVAPIFDQVALINFLFFFIIVTNILQCRYFLTFGMNSETLYFLKICVICLIFQLNILLWTFYENLEENIFFTTLVFIPISNSLVENYLLRFYKLQQTLCNTALNSPFNEDCLEHLIQVGQQSQFDLIQNLQEHSRFCCDVSCPCDGKVYKFFGKKQHSMINKLVQYQFQKLLRKKIKEKHLSNFSDITSKFCSFLENYRQNQVLSFKCIQEIVSTLKHQYLENYLGIQKYFFSAMVSIILERNIECIKRRDTAQIQLQHHDFLILSDVCLFFEYEQQIFQQLLNQLDMLRRFWDAYKSSEINQTEKFLNFIEKIEIGREQIRRLSEEFEKQRNHTHLQSIIYLRLQLIISLCLFDNLQSEITLTQRIHDMEIEMLASNRVGIFTNMSFLNGQSISIVASISHNQIGEIESRISDYFLDFFGYPKNTEFKYINQLMPSNLSTVHNGLIENYFLSGNSNLINKINEAFILNGSNTIENVYLSLGSFFQQNVTKFSMISHIKKVQKEQKDSLDILPHGQIIVDENLQILGISKSIYQRVNNIMKLKSEFELIKPSSIYQSQIHQLIPECLKEFEKFYQVLELKNQQHINSPDNICSKERGLFQICQIQQSQRTIQPMSSQKIITTKSMVQFVSKLLLEDEEVQNQRVLKHLPIEYSIRQRYLTLYDNKEGKLHKLYFIVDVQFLDDIENGRTSTRLNTHNTNELLVPNRKRTRMSTFMTTKYPQQSHVNQIKETELQQSQALLMSHEQQEEVEFLQEQSQSSSKRSSSELYNTVTSVQTHLKNSVYTKSFICYFIVLLFFLVLKLLFIALFAIAFQQRSNVESLCPEIINYAINFFDYYSQTFSGSRHLIFYRDFLKLQKNESFFINNYSLTFTGKDKIYSSWFIIQYSLDKLASMNEDQILVQISQQVNGQLEIYYLNEKNEKQSQTLNDQASYYYLMISSFYDSMKSFPTNYKVFLYGIQDTYQQIYQRSMLYLNFFSVAQYTQQSIQDCRTIITQQSNYYDEIAQEIFYSFYIIVILITCYQFFLIILIGKAIQLYIKLFWLCLYEDSSTSILHIQKLRTFISQFNIVFTLNEFREINNLSFFQLQDLKNQYSQKNIVVKSQMTNKIKRTGTVPIDKSQGKPNILLNFSLIMIQMLILCIYTLAFQLLYTQVSDQIAPFFDQALNSQELRLNLLIVVNRWDQNIIKQYYTSCNLSNLQISNLNAYKNAILLSMTDSTSSEIESAVQYLKDNDFSSLASSELMSLDSETIDILLNQDICKLTGCSMSELLVNRTFADQFSYFFEEGLIRMYQQLQKVILLSDAILLEPTNITETITSIITEQSYIIYYVWGYDLFNFQIQQFTLYFINMAYNELGKLQLFNEQYIIIFGSLVVVLIIAIQYKIVFSLIKYYKLAKISISLIPLPIMFEKNIPRQLKYIKQRYYF